MASEEDPKGKEENDSEDLPRIKDLPRIEDLPRIKDGERGTP